MTILMLKRWQLLATPRERWRMHRKQHWRSSSKWTKTISSKKVYYWKFSQNIGCANSPEVQS